MPQHVRDAFESFQIAIYFVSIILGTGAAFAFPALSALEWTINPALAVMLFVTFLQVPLSELPQALRNKRFLGALLVINFIVIPLIVAALIRFLPNDPMLRLGVLLVLLTPCVDYVVTFTHLGKGDAKSLLAATPMLLILQMAALPLYLGVLLGPESAKLVAPGPFVHAFVWLIAVPLGLAWLVQWFSARSNAMGRVSAGLGILPVPATALVLLLVLAAVTPRVGEAYASACAAAPLYIVFAIIAPVCGWLVSLAFRLSGPHAIAVAFSAATRNSLVVLPFAFAVPGGVPLIPAVIVTQTVVELLSELVYVRFLKRLPVHNS